MGSHARDEHIPYKLFSYLEYEGVTRRVSCSRLNSAPN